MEEVIEIVKKATVYGEDKGGSSHGKPENKQKRQSGGKGGGKGNKGNWGPSGGPKGKVQIISGDSQQEVTAGQCNGGDRMVPARVGVKHQNPTNRVRGPRANQRKKPPLACFLCGEKHIVKNCPQWQAVLEATKKSGNGKLGTLQPMMCGTQVNAGGVLRGTIWDRKSEGKLY